MAKKQSHSNNVVLAISFKLESSNVLTSLVRMLTAIAGLLAAAAKIAMIWREAAF